MTWLGNNLFNKRLINPSSSRVGESTSKNTHKVLSILTLSTIPATPRYDVHSQWTRRVYDKLHTPARKNLKNMRDKNI